MIQLYDEYPILQSLLGEFKGLSWTQIITLLPAKEKAILRHSLPRGKSYILREKQKTCLIGVKISEEKEGVVYDK